tara:strand:- start:2345 stop:2536 length:192 start_codon:yes stop_codon:yes gene_type:complete
LLVSGYTNAIILGFNTIRVKYEINHISEKNGADFTMSSAQGECLPLPHTKGTKPAPSVVKVLV